MDERTRFRLAGYGSALAIAVWLIVLVAAIVVAVRSVQAILRGRFLDLFIMVAVAGVIYGTWYVSNYLLAGLLTNNTRGYRPWTWGMVPQNEHGESVQQFEIPLTYSEVKDAFIDASDPRVTALRKAASQLRTTDSDDSPPPSDGRAV